MAGQLKEVRNRIKSIQNSQQITKAMKLVSATKLRRAQNAIVQMRPYAEELRGLLGNLQGLLGQRGLPPGTGLLLRTNMVHTIGMRFTIDVAFCDRDGVVLRISTLRPWRFSPLVWRSRLVIEAEAGAFERWGLRVGDRVEVKE